MATHSSTLAWKIPWAEEPGRLQSMGSLSWTQRSDFTFTFLFHAVEKEMAIHSSILAWRIPGTGEPGGLQSMGSLSWTLLSDFTFTFQCHALEKEMATHSSVSCLVNPRDGGAWWAAISEAAQSRIRLK